MATRPKRKRTANILLTKQELQEYLNDGYTPATIAKSLSVSPGDIQEKIRKFGIKWPTKGSRAQARGSPKGSTSRSSRGCVSSPKFQPSVRITRVSIPRDHPASPVVRRTSPEGKSRFSSPKRTECDDGEAVSEQPLEKDPRLDSVLLQVVKDNPDNYAEHIHGIIESMGFNFNLDEVATKLQELRSPQASPCKEPPTPSLNPKGARGRGRPRKGPVEESVADVEEDTSGDEDMEGDQGSKGEIKVAGGLQKLGGAQASGATPHRESPTSPESKEARQRGRPRKIHIVEDAPSAKQDEDIGEAVEVAEAHAYEESPEPSTKPKIARGRGRPKKSPVVEAVADVGDDTSGNQDVEDAQGVKDDQSTGDGTGGVATNSQRLGGSQAAEAPPHDESPEPSAEPETRRRKGLRKRSAVETASDDDVTSDLEEEWGQKTGKKKKKRKKSRGKKWEPRGNQIKNRAVKRKGRPIIDLPLENLMHCVDSGLTRAQTAEALGTSEGTIYRYFRRYKIRKSDRLCNLSAEELDAMVTKICADHPDWGQIAIRQYLSDQGYHFLRAQVRDSVRRVDPVGTQLRRLKSLALQWNRVSVKTLDRILPADGINMTSKASFLSRRPRSGLNGLNEEDSVRLLKEIVSSSSNGKNKESVEKGVESIDEGGVEVSGASTDNMVIGAPVNETGPGEEIRQAWSGIDLRERSEEIGSAAVSTDPDRQRLTGTKNIQGDFMSPANSQDEDWKERLSSMILKCPTTHPDRAMASVRRGRGPSVHIPIEELQECVRKGFSATRIADHFQTNHLNVHKHLTRYRLGRVGRFERMTDDELDELVVGVIREFRVLNGKEVYTKVREKGLQVRKDDIRKSLCRLHPKGKHRGCLEVVLQDDWREARRRARLAAAGITEQEVQEVEKQEGAKEKGDGGDDRIIMMGTGELEREASNGNTDIGVLPGENGSILLDERTGMICELPPGAMSFSDENTHIVNRGDHGSSGSGTQTSAVAMDPAAVQSELVIDLVIDPVAHQSELATNSVQPGRDDNTAGQLGTDATVMDVPGYEHVNVANHSALDDDARHRVDESQSQSNPLDVRGEGNLWRQVVSGAAAGGVLPDGRTGMIGGPPVSEGATAYQHQQQAQQTGEGIPQARGALFEGQSGEEMAIELCAGQNRANDYAATVAQDQGSRRGVISGDKSSQSNFALDGTKGRVSNEESHIGSAGSGVQVQPRLDNASRHPEHPGVLSEGQFKVPEEQSFDPGVGHNAPASSSSSTGNPAGMQGEQVYILEHTDGSQQLEVLVEGSKVDAGGERIIMQITDDTATVPPATSVPGGELTTLNTIQASGLSATILMELDRIAQNIIASPSVTQPESTVPHTPSEG